MERTELADQWTEWFAAYDAGGVTRKAFCEARGVKLSTFDYWRRRLRKKDEESKTLKVGTVAAQTLTIRIVIGNDGYVSDRKWPGSGYRQHRWVSCSTKPVEGGTSNSIPEEFLSAD